MDYLNAVMAGMLLLALAAIAFVSAFNLTPLNNRHMRAPVAKSLARVLLLLGGGVCLVEAIKFLLGG
jgi:hypothetical protein